MSDIARTFRMRGLDDNRPTSVPDEWIVDVARINGETVAVVEQRSITVMRVDKKDARELALSWGYMEDEL